MTLKKFLPKSNSGYTLIEVIVIISVIGILTTITFTSLTINNQRDATSNATLDLRNAVRSSQEQALANQVSTTNNSPADYYGVILVGSTSGTVFKATKFKIIRVERGVTTSCTGSDCTNSGTGSTTCCGATVVNTVSLPIGVSISTPQVGSHFPVAVLFQKGSTVPRFLDETGAVLIATSITFTINGQGTPPTVAVDQLTGRIDSTGVF